MGMHVTRLTETKPFAPPQHSGVRAMQLQGGAATTQDTSVGLSHYLPGGEAETAPQPAETIYVVLTGELVFTSDGVDETLRPLDSAHFTANTVRRVTNRTHLPASMLVIRPADQ